MIESGGHGCPDSIIGWRGSPVGRPCAIRQVSIVSKRLGSALPFRAIAGLAQVQEPRGSGGEA